MARHVGSGGFAALGEFALALLALPMPPSVAPAGAQDEALTLDALAPSEAQEQPSQVVYGQATFTDTGYTLGVNGFNASSVRIPNSVAVDSSGNVYVVDSGLGRVLELPSTCRPADCSPVRVYGQTSFTTQPTVHTQETWSEDVLSSTTGALLQHEPAADYSETYTVNLIDSLLCERGNPRC